MSPLNQVDDEGLSDHSNVLSSCGCFYIFTCIVHSLEDVQEKVKPLVDLYGPPAVDFSLHLLDTEVYVAAFFRHTVVADE